MEHQEKQQFAFLRRMTKAGIGDCRRALIESEGDICIAIRSLMSHEEIREAIIDRRIRECDGARPLSGEFAVREGEVLAQLDAELRFEDRLEKEGKVPVGLPPQLPAAFRSYVELVRFVKTAMRSPHSHDVFVATCAAKGISESDIGYILDRIEGGTFRAAAQCAGANDLVPDPHVDPVGHAAFMLAIKPRRWWQFWRC